jgi:NADPH:quinone reductase-like Zn-dependent oxidoreductase
VKACRIHRFGSPEVITLEDMEKPKPGEGEVLVRVKAAGVGTWDAWIRAGKSAACDRDRRRRKANMPRLPAAAVWLSEPISFRLACQSAACAPDG